MAAGLVCCARLLQLLLLLLNFNVTAASGVPGTLLSSTHLPLMSSLPWRRPTLASGHSLLAIATVCPMSSVVLARMSVLRPRQRAMVRKTWEEARQARVRRVGAVRVVWAGAGREGAHNEQSGAKSEGRATPAHLTFCGFGSRHTVPVTPPGRMRPRTHHCFASACGEREQLPVQAVLQAGERVELLLRVLSSSRTEGQQGTWPHSTAVGGSSNSSQGRPSPQAPGPPGRSVCPPRQSQHLRLLA